MRFPTSSALYIMFVLIGRTFNWDSLTLNCNFYISSSWGMLRLPLRTGIDIDMDQLYLSQ